MRPLLLASRALKRVSAYWKRIAAGLLALALVSVSLVFLTAWSGVYNVAASRGHWDITDRFLRFGMVNSVKARAPNIQPPPLDNPDLIRLGAAHFHTGCAHCHGAPGAPVSPISQRMLPPPPDLQTHVGSWTDQELFWIVKHGIKYVGMPSWVAQSRDDEVWAVVAFLRSLPKLDSGAYLKLALGDLSNERDERSGIAIADDGAAAAGACGRCHGFEDRPPLSGLVPRLHGQPRDVLINALQAYAAGGRYSGVMQPIAAELSSPVIEQVAAYYAGLPALSPRQQTHEEIALIEAGRRLATEGDPEAGIPACAACHGAAALPTYPRLAGQHARYIANQLHLWRIGPRSRAPSDAIMAPIAQRLSDRQIMEVSAYFAGLPAEAPLAARENATAR